jgi:hypothetical protein
VSDFDETITIRVKKDTKEYVLRQIDDDEFWLENEESEGVTVWAKDLFEVLNDFFIDSF